MSIKSNILWQWSKTWTEVFPVLLYIRTIIIIRIKFQKFMSANCTVLWVYGLKNVDC